MHKTVVHAPSCGQAVGHPVILSRKANRDAYPHHCLPGGFAGVHVVEVVEEIPDHLWRDSLNWPAGRPEALCRDCRQPKAAHP